MTDFTRHVVCVLGLPFDVVTLNDCEKQVTHALASGQSCFFSTPNLNFLAGCFNNPDFRKSVLVSDLSVADGSSVVMLAKLLGIKLPERVAGSDLFEKLTHQSRTSLRVYFFGGQPGIAEKASARLHQTGKANIQSVGWQSPGFGSIQEMSTETVLKPIRDSGANFLLVALGAAKGQAWILENMPKLPPCVISHLGAVINFTAGEVKRAPLWVRRVGMEWAWRISQEPNLWKRYMQDALAVIKAIANLMVRHQTSKLINRSTGQHHLTIRQESADRVVLSLSGSWGQHNLAELQAGLETATAHGAPHIVLDASELDHLDPHALGSILILLGHQLKQQGSFEIAHASQYLQGLLKAHQCGFLLKAQAATPN